MSKTGLLLDFLTHALRADPSLGKKLLEVFRGWAAVANAPREELLKIEESIVVRVGAVDAKVDAALDAEFKDTQNNNS